MRPADETYFEGPGGPASRIRFTAIVAGKGDWPKAPLLYALDQWGRVWTLFADDTAFHWVRLPAPDQAKPAQS